MFKASIHSRQNLPRYSKLHYLLSRLKGAAKELMVGFNRTDAEYEEAINISESTYGYNRRLIEAHLHAVLDIVPPDATSKD